jgi:hypothetical protein
MDNGAESTEQLQKMRGPETDTPQEERARRVTKLTDRRNKRHRQAAALAWRCSRLPLQHIATG